MSCKFPFPSENTRTRHEREYIAPTETTATNGEGAVKIAVHAST